MVYPTDNNANADWSLNDELKSILFEYGHEQDLPVTDYWHNWETKK